MALIQVNFISKSLMRTVTMNVILPVDRMPAPGEELVQVERFPTLYLLHGILGNYTDWVSGTMVQRWAEEKNLAVVMPSGDNLFYLDHCKAHNLYGQFIGEELVEITRRMFPLSDRREDTFLAGLSMGGYGALRNGLKYHDTFGYVAGLSSALIIEELPQSTNDAPNFFQCRDYLEAVFGDLEKVAGSDADPRELVKQIKEKKGTFPKLYLACGTEDFLLPSNRSFHNFLKQEGVDCTYVEEPGGHEWDFWNRQIRQLIGWLPLQEAQAAISSGNVGT